MPPRSKKVETAPPIPSRLRNPSNGGALFLRPALTASKSEASDIVEEPNNHDAHCKQSGMSTARPASLTREEKLHLHHVGLPERFLEPTEVVPWIRSTYVPKPTAAGVKSKRIYSSNLDQEIIARLAKYWCEFEEMNRYWSLQRHVDMDLMGMNSGGAVSPEHELDYEWRKTTGFPTWPDRLREIRPAEPYRPLPRLRDGPQDSYFLRVDDLGTDDPLDGDQHKSYVIGDPIAPSLIAKSPSPELDDAPILNKVYDGQVTGLKSYGAFALLHGVQGNVTGMIFTRYIGEFGIWCAAADVLRMYQNIKIKVVKIFPNGKIDLSMKGIDQHTGEDTTPAVDDAPIQGKVYDGTVAAFSTFGVFVKLEGVKGVVEGLVHKTRMAHSTIDVPSQFLKRFQHVKVKVLKVQKDDRKGKDKVDLSMNDVDQATGKELIAAAESQSAAKPGAASTVGSPMDILSNSDHPPPEEDEAPIMYKIYEGHVKSIPRPAYGAFVEIYGVRGRPQGLVYQTRISNEISRKVTDVVKRLQHVRVRVVNIDGNKIDLSMKDVDQTTGEGLASGLQSVRHEVLNQGANQNVGANPMGPTSLYETPAQLVGDMDEKPVMDKIYNGTVKSIHNLGIFVELDNVKSSPDGMVAAKALKTYYVRHPSDVVRPYQKVKVKVTAICPNGKIDLSMVAVDQTTGEDMSGGGDVEQGQILEGGEVGRKRPAPGDLQNYATRRRLNDDGKSDGSLPY